MLFGVLSVVQGESAIAKDQKIPPKNSTSAVIKRVPLDKAKRDTSLLASKLFLESNADQNPQAITTHKLNYFIPFSYNDNPNLNPVNSNGAGQTSARSLDNLEAKFQVSFKAPIFCV
jgi:outer membrane phospholipase A